MGRRAPVEPVAESEIPSDEVNGESSGETRAPLTSAQRLAASSATITEVAPDPFGREAKHFTEIRVLNRDVSCILSVIALFFFFLKVISQFSFTLQVRIVLEGVDKFSNLIGSVYYPDGDSAKDLALELVENVCASTLFKFEFIIIFQKIKVQIFEMA